MQSPTCCWSKRKTAVVVLHHDGQAILNPARTKNGALSERITVFTCVDQLRPSFSFARTAGSSSRTLRLQPNVVVSRRLPSYPELHLSLRSSLPLRITTQRFNNMPLMPIVCRRSKRSGRIERRGSAGEQMRQMRQAMLPRCATAPYM